MGEFDRKGIARLLNYGRPVESEEEVDRLLRSVQEAEAAKEDTLGHCVQKSDPEHSPTLDLPIELLIEMEQPWPLHSEEELKAMANSIRINGILQRILVRPLEDGRYQIISGRNRRRAAMLAGMDTVPCEVRAMSDDMAQEAMLETNLNQREHSPISATAWAYRALYELKKRQGFRSDLTSGPVGPKSEEQFNRSDEEVADTLGIGGRTLKRYIRLTYLCAELMTALDDKRLRLRAGIELSYLSEDNQRLVADQFQGRYHLLSEKLAAALRKAGEREELTKERIDNLFCPAVKSKQRINLSLKPVYDLFPVGATQKEMEKIVIAAVKLYFSMQGNKNQMDETKEDN